MVSSDERLLHPDPYPSREAWCADRIAKTEERLAALPPWMPTVLVNHFPAGPRTDGGHALPGVRAVVRHGPHGRRPTAVGAVAVVYGHLHIPRTSWHDGVRHEEVSLGYPQEQEKYPSRPCWLTQILPFEPASTVPADVV